MTTKKTEPSPVVLGTGLVALDEVVTENSQEPVRHWTGGTCGNVLLALKYLGWRSKPIARLGTDETAESLLADLSFWRVDQSWISKDEEGSTPLIIHRISKNSSGNPIHSFSWRCLSCGRRFPGYKPVLASVAEELAAKIKSVDVFFFDRVSRGALVLAHACADKGAVVVFEPSGVGTPVLFQEACEVAHVLKYSHERLADIPVELDSARSVKIQLETLGDQGLRYRTRRSSKGFGSWVTLDPFAVEVIKDTAGAGDWTSAGIIDLACRGGLKQMEELSAEKIREAVRYGQALAAWTCGFEGARGGMYSVEKRTFRAQVERIIEGEAARHDKILQLKTKQQDRQSSLCACCNPVKKRHNRSG